MELNQDLAYHTNTRLGAFALQRQVVEIVDDGANGFLVAAELLAFADLALALFHPIVEQLLGSALLDFVGTRAIQALHKQIAVEQREDGVVQHGCRYLEARVGLIELLERQ